MCQACKILLVNVRSRVGVALRFMAKLVGWDLPNGSVQDLVAQPQHVNERVMLKRRTQDARLHKWKSLVFTMSSSPKHNVRDKIAGNHLPALNTAPNTQRTFPYASCVQRKCQFQQCHAASRAMQKQRETHVNNVILLVAHAFIQRASRNQKFGKQI